MDDSKIVISPSALSFCRNSAERLLTQDYSGHDWEHTLRVMKNAETIYHSEYASNPKYDLNLLLLCACLHDVADHKFYPEEEARKKVIFSLLTQTNIGNKEQQIIFGLIESISFSQQKSCDPRYVELSYILQDADRLDAMGAIGIARTFAYGGKNGRKIYDLSGNKPDSIQHFYDKLLHLADAMHTDTARQLAAERQNFMNLFLNEFYHEINPQEVPL